MVKVARTGIRGTRVGAGLPGETERGEGAERRQVAYFCSQGHRSELIFAAEAAAPEQWDCPRCGLPSGRDPDNPPTADSAAPYKTHMAYVRERRSDADGALLLGEALAKLRGTS
jgi:hypothetical protein